MHAMSLMCCNVCTICVVRELLAERNARLYEVKPFMCGHTSLLFNFTDYPQFSMDNNTIQ